MEKSFIFMIGISFKKKSINKKISLNKTDFFYKTKKHKLNNYLFTKIGPKTFFHNNINTIAPIIENIQSKGLKNSLHYRVKFPKCLAYRLLNKRPIFQKLPKPKNLPDLSLE